MPFIPVYIPRDPTGGGGIAGGVGTGAVEDHLIDTARGWVLQSTPAGDRPEILYSQEDNTLYRLQDDGSYLPDSGPQQL